MRTVAGHFTRDRTIFLEAQESRSNFSYFQRRKENVYWTYSRWFSSFLFPQQNSGRPSGCLTRTAMELSRKKNLAGLCVPWDNSRERRNWERCCRKSTLTVSGSSIIHLRLLIKVRKSFGVQCFPVVVFDARKDPITLSSEYIICANY